MATTSGPARNLKCTKENAHFFNKGECEKPLQKVTFELSNKVHLHPL